MKTKLLVLFVLASMHAMAQTKIRVLTYNIYHGEQAFKAGQPNIDSVAALINRLHPDFAAFQEVDSATGRSAKIYGHRINFIEELAKRTGMQGYFGKAMDYDGGGYGDGVLSRQPCKATVVPLAAPSGGEPRVLVYVQADLPGGKQVIFGGTHLCYQYNDNRMAQVGQITGLFKNGPLPAIICGDFNTNPTGEAYRQMLQQWQDAAVVYGAPHNTFSSDKPRYRIDYAFLSKNKQWKVTRVEVLPYHFSDHMPVLVEMELD